MSEMSSQPVVPEERPVWAGSMTHFQVYLRSLRVRGTPSDHFRSGSSSRSTSKEPSAAWRMESSENIGIFAASSGFQWPSLDVSHSPTIVAARTWAVVNELS